MEVPLRTLKPGQRFSLTLETTGRVIRGELIRVNLCSATVKLDSTGNVKTFKRLNKKTGEYKDVNVTESPSLEHWASDTAVQPESSTDSPARQHGQESERQLGLAFLG